MAKPGFWLSVLTDVSAKAHYAAVLAFHSPAKAALPRPPPESPGFRLPTSLSSGLEKTVAGIGDGSPGSEEEDEREERVAYRPTCLVLVSQHYLPSIFRVCHPACPRR